MSNARTSEGSTVATVDELESAAVTNSLGSPDAGCCCVKEHLRIAQLSLGLY